MGGAPDSPPAAAAAPAQTLATSSGKCEDSGSTLLAWLLAQAVVELPNHRVAVWACQVPWLSLAAGRRSSGCGSQELTWGSSRIPAPKIQTSQCLTPPLPSFGKRTRLYTHTHHLPGLKHL